MPKTLVEGPEPTVGRALLAILAVLLLTSADPLSAGLNRWTSDGPYGGGRRVAADAVDPDLLYASTFGEVYRSEDGGTHWSRALDGGGVVTEILPNPHRAETAYVLQATGELWKTMDGGESWTAILPPNVDTLAVHPSDPDTLVAGVATDLDHPVLGGSELARSRDGGNTWSPLPGMDHHVRSVTIDPSDSEVLYAGTGQGLFKSEDGGETFDQLESNRPFGRLTFDPLDPETLYAGTSEGLEKSRDGGATWTLLLASDHSPTFEIHPGTGRIWAAAEDLGLQTSDDGGATWEARREDLFPAYRGSSIASRAGSAIEAPGLKLGVGGIALDPVDSERLFVAAFLGVFRSLDGGESWEASHRGIRGISVFGVLPGQEGFPMLLGTPVGTFRGGLDTVGDRILPPVPGYYLTASPSDREIVYAGSFRALWRSRDRGATWRRIQSFILSLAELEVAPTDGEVVYALGIKEGIFASFDAGETWTVTKDLGVLFFGSLEVDAGDSRRVYLSFNGRLMVAENGTDFVESESPPPGAVELLEADPYRAGRIFARTAEGWFRSEDAGTTWQGVGRGLDTLDVDSLTFHPDLPNLLYAATDDGVRVSIDGGDTWVPLLGGLRERAVKHVALDPDSPNRLWAGTHDGLFVIDRVTELALSGSRFRVEVEWKDYGSLRGPGVVGLVPGESPGETPLRTPDSAVLWFFDPDNWEAQIKVLDARTVNHHFWVLFSAATDVAHELVVEDTRCSDVRTYSNPLGLRAPAITDTDAFPGCPGSASAPSCVPEPGVVCLGRDGRFRAELTWTDFQGDRGPARPVTLPDPGLATSPDSGIFYFFDRDNWELLVKVLDVCSWADRFWVFTAASTDVEYTVTVTDTVSGESRSYSNPLGRDAEAVADTDAFATCDL